MEIITIIIRPIDWTEGNLYGLRLRISGENPEAHIGWGNGQVESFYGNEIEVYHSYPRNKYRQFKVDVNVISGEVQFIDPCGGDCDIEHIDFSGAQSIREIWMENCRSIKLDNPHLEKLMIRIYNGNECDLSKCPDLRQLSFDGGINMRGLDLSACHKLERLEVGVMWQSSEFSKIIIANDAPLKYVSLSSVNLSKGCMQFIKNLIDSKNGEMELK